MSKIISSKEILIRCNKGFFKMFVSEHDNGNFYVGVLYYEKKGSWSNNEDVILSFHLETFVDSSENKAVEKAKSWVKKNLANDAEFIPIK